jgi:hypothetical protein
MKDQKLTETCLFTNRLPQPLAQVEQELAEMKERITVMQQLLERIAADGGEK